MGMEQHIGQILDKWDGLSIGRTDEQKRGWNRKSDAIIFAHQKKIETHVVCLGALILYSTLVHGLSKPSSSFACIRGEPVLPTYNECTRLPVCIGRVFDMLMVRWRTIVILEAFFNQMFSKSFQWPCTIGMMIWTMIWTVTHLWMCDDIPEDGSGWPG